MSGSRRVELVLRMREEVAGTRESAWDGLNAGQTRLLMGVAGALGGDHDAAMDR